MSDYQIRIDVDEHGLQTVGTVEFRTVLHVASGSAASRLARLGVAGCYILDLGGAYYCGTAGCLGRRLRAQIAAAGPDLRRVVALVSEPEMTSLEAEHLEHLMIDCLGRGRVPLLNMAEPGPRRLRPAELCAVEQIWASARILLRGIGIDVPQPTGGVGWDLSRTRSHGEVQVAQAGDLHVLICDCVHAVVWKTGSGWLVMPGSLIRREPVASAPARARADRERLLAEGKLARTADPRLLMLLEPVEVESASAVVVFVMGAKHQPGRVLARLVEVRRPRLTR